MPVCNKCGSEIKKSVLTCTACNSNFHPGCLLRFVKGKPSDHCCVLFASKLDQGLPIKKSCNSVSTSSQTVVETTAPTQSSSTLNRKRLLSPESQALTQAAKQHCVSSVPSLDQMAESPPSWFAAFLNEYREDKAFQRSSMEQLSTHIGSIEDKLSTLEQTQKIETATLRNEIASIASNST